MVPIEAIPYVSEVIVSVATRLSQVASFFFEIGADVRWVDDALLNLLIEADNMGVGIAEQGLLESRIKGDDASTQKRLYPSSLNFGHKGLYPRHQFGLDPLAFKRRNDDAPHVLFSLLFFLTGTIMSLSPPLKATKSSSLLIAIVFPSFFIFVTP